jgi:hypothetical protein
MYLLNTRPTQETQPKKLELPRGLLKNVFYLFI